jgi:isocitrate lyase
MEHVSTSSLAQSCTAPSPLPGFSDWLELAKLLIDLDWVAMKLEGPFQPTEKAARGHSPVLIPTKEAVIKLEFAKRTAESLQLSLQVFACTDARAAVALKADTDARDRKFLSGPKTPDGLHAFCGSLDAAISRALVYARYADVVCFKSSNADFPEAVRFASELKASFPSKRLAFGHAPRPDGAGWNEFDHGFLARKLRSVGYDHYFVTQFGRTIFPFTPVSGSWVLGPL